MDAFEYRDGQLLCENVPVEDIAGRFGTPAYVYSAATLRDHYRKIASAFGELDTLVCFSVKGLSNLSILKLLAAEGSGFDVVSGGELARVQAAGGDVGKVVFAGVGKTDAELTAALKAGICYFNVESEQEFENLSRLAADLGVRARAALRVNPDVYDPKTHAYTTTGKKETKFGVDIDRAVDFFERYGRDANVSLAGVHLHLGSPIYSADPYVAAIGKALAFIEDLRGRGLTVDTLNLGGGFAADYVEGQSPSAADYAAEIVPLLRGQGLKLILEPGRSIGCNAAVLLTRVLYTKTGGEKHFAIVDSAMTDLIRPAIYDAEHFVYPAALPAGADAPPRRPDYEAPGGQTVDIVGGVCETTDVLAKARTLPPLQRDDLLAIFSAGAYGFVMSSQYNSRPRACEVLVDGDTVRLIRPRETYDDLFASERELLE